MDFEIVGVVRRAETIVAGRAIRQLRRLRKRYGKGRWRKLKGVATVRLQDGTAGDEDQVPATGLKMGRAARAQKRFAVCIENKGYKASLEIGKLYRVIPDTRAEEHGYLRIVDESGEDYGYAASRFFVLDVPKPLEKALLKAAS